MQNLGVLSPADASEKTMNKHLPALFLVLVASLSYGGESNLSTVLRFFPEKESYQYYPIMVSPVGDAQIAARIRARGYKTPLPEIFIRIAQLIDGPNKKIAQPEYVMTKLWDAFASGKVENVVALYDPTEADAARLKYADAMVDIRKLHSGAFHSVVHKAYFGDYIVLLYLTHAPNRQPIAWEEVLRKTTVGYRLTNEIKPNSFPKLIMESIAEAQIRDSTRPVKVTGWKNVPNTMVREKDGLSTIVGKPSPNAIDIAWRGRMVPTIILENYTGNNASLLFLKGLRQLYADKAPVSSINQLWKINYNEALNEKVPLDPLAWYGSKDATEVLAIFDGPQGSVVSCRRTKADGSVRLFFVTPTKSGYRIATSLLAPDPSHGDPFSSLNALLTNDLTFLTVLNVD